MPSPKLVPELVCSDFERSLAFYTGVLGFSVQYARPEEQPVGRSFVAGELAHPYGRGINLQIEVGDVAALYAAVQASGAAVYLPVEDAWYRADDVLLGNRQFIVQDPDGYLLRLFENLGERSF